jgi:hypothetical protein
LKTDEILEMARQCGFERLGHDDRDLVCYPEEVEALVNLALAKERREWAKEFAGLGEWACVHIIEARDKE